VSNDFLNQSVIELCVLILDLRVLVEELKVLVLDIWVSTTVCEYSYSTDSRPSQCVVFLMAYYSLQYTTHMVWSPLTCQYGHLFAICSQSNASQTSRKKEPTYWQVTFCRTWCPYVCMFDCSACR